MNRPTNRDRANTDSQPANGDGRRTNRATRKVTKRTAGKQTPPATKTDNHQPTAEHATHDQPTTDDGEWGQPVPMDRWRAGTLLFLRAMMLVCWRLEPKAKGPTAQVNEEHQTYLTI